MGASNTYLTPDIVRVRGTVGGATTLTRPADTTAYAAGDEISNSTSQASAAPFIFANVARSAGGGGIIRSILITSSDNAAAFAPALWLFTAAPTMVGDNAAWALKAADAAAVINAPTPDDTFRRSIGSAAGDTASLFFLGGPNTLFSEIAYQCASTSTSIYGVLLADVYTPLSAGTFTVTLTVERR